MYNLKKRERQFNFIAFQNTQKRKWQKTQLQERKKKKKKRKKVWQWE